MLHTCKYCGKTFKDTRHKDRKYCSKECASKAQTTKLIVKCDYCGKETAKTPSKIKNSKNIFCSHECYSKFRSLYYHGERMYNYVGLTATCLNCSKEFRTEQNILDIGKGKFCSRACSEEYYRQHPEEHSRYIDGSSQYNHNKRKYKSKTRGLGSKFINNAFEGSDGHHFTKEDIIFIPKELHTVFGGHSLRKNASEYMKNNFNALNNLIIFILIMQRGYKENK